MTIELVCEESSPRILTLADGADQVVFQGQHAPGMFYATAKAKGITPDDYAGEYGDGFTFCSTDAQYILIPEYQSGEPCLIIA